MNEPTQRYLSFKTNIKIFIKNTHKTIFSGAIFELSEGVRNPLMHWTKKADCAGESVTLNMAFYGCNSAKEMLESLKKQDFCKSSA